MPQERLTTPALYQTQCGASVRKIREILRLKWELQLSERVIARICSTTRSTVADYIRRAAAAGLTWPLPENQGDSQLSELLYPKTQEPTLKATFLPDWEKTHLELRKKGFTLRLLWAEYLEKYPQGYGYSQYCQLYRNWAGKIQPTMRLDHKAGEKMFVDYWVVALSVVGNSFSLPGSLIWTGSVFLTAQSGGQSALRVPFSEFSPLLYLFCFLLTSLTPADN